MSDLPEGTTPFDRDEIKPCAVCKRGIGHSGAIEFYEVTITQVLVDINSIRKIHGTELIVGHPGIAKVMASTSRIGVRLPATRLIICHDCFLDRPDDTALVYLWADEESK